MSAPRDIGERLVDFSANVIKALHGFEDSPVARKVEDQLVRSAMSAGANYEEARGAHSRPDFCHKLQISLKEMRETRFWLCVADKARLSGDTSLGSLIQEATELRAILAKCVATARGTAKEPQATAG